MSVIEQTDDGNDSEEISLGDTELYFGVPYLKLLKEVIHELGFSESITLGAVMRLSKPHGGTTFARQSVIAATARQSLRTVNRNIAKLVEDGWLSNTGRQRLSERGAFRRSCTLVVTEKSWRAHRHFPAPFWLLDADLLPSEKLVISYLATQLKQKDWIENGDGEDLGCADERDAMSLREIQEHTRLERHTVWRTRCRLLDRGLLVLDSAEDFDCGYDRLKLNPDRYVRIVSADCPKRVRKTSKPGNCDVADGKAGVAMEQSGVGAEQSGVAQAGNVTYQGNNVAFLKYGNLLGQPSSLGQPPEATSCKQPLSQRDSGGVPPSPEVDKGFMYVDQERELPLVGRLCDDLGLTSGECQFIWVLACWHHYSAVSFDTIASAVFGCCQKPRTNAIGYVLEHIRNAITPKRFEALKARTRIPKGPKLSVPKSATYMPQTIALADQLAMPRAPTEAELLEHNRQALESIKAMATANAQGTY